MITRSEILANRKKWIEYLAVPTRKKLKGSLSNRNGARCCLGHACHILGVEKTFPNFDAATIYFGHDEEPDLAPQELIDILGLWDNKGGAKYHNFKFKIGDYQYSTLAEANDGETTTLYNFTPPVKQSKIAEYLLSVIEGGIYTPFRSLLEYKD